MKDSLYLIDYALRRLFSVLFRLIIVIYGIIIILTFENRFPIYVYLIGAVGYYLTLFIIYVKSYKLLIIRILIDYTFIVFILLGKDLTDFFIFTYTLLPLINLPNRTGIGKNLSLFLCIPISIIMFILLKNWVVIVPYFIILGINEFERLRMNIRNINQQQFRKIDNFYIDNYYPNKLYKVYRHIVDDIEKTLIGKFIKVDEIICFRFNNGGLKLYNSSKLILSYIIPNTEEIIEGLDAELIKRDQEIIVDGISNKKNLVLVITGKNRKFLFFILINYYFNIPFVTNALIESVFVPSLRYLVKLFEFEWELRNINKAFLENIKKKYEFVLRSTNAMHFVKNKLSPAKTLAELTDLYFNKSRQDTALKTLIRTSIKKSLNNFNVIEKHAKFILEKSENPFIVSNVESHKFGRLVDLIRNTYYYHIENSIFSFEGDISQINNISLNFDEIILEIVFTDLCENINKYYAGKSEIKIIYNETNLTVIFENNIDTRKVNIVDLIKVIQDYNTSKKWEINEQKSHGFILIKSYLNQMEIENNIYLNNEVFGFHLNFKVFRNEIINH